MIDGFVLAGGRSSRMGVDKARLPFPGRWPMATHVGLVLAEVCGQVALIRRGSDDLPWPRPDGTDWEVVREADDGDPHPLRGLATACAAGRTPFVAVASCDVPFLPAEGWRRLRAALPIGRGGDESPSDGVAGAVIACAGAERHPLVGIWPRAVGPYAAEAAARGESARAFAARATGVELPADWLRNVNRWEDTGRERSVLQALAEGLPWLVGPDRERLLEGERGRLAARGCVDLRADGEPGRLR